MSACQRIPAGFSADVEDVDKTYLKVAVLPSVGNQSAEAQAADRSMTNVENTIEAVKG